MRSFVRPDIDHDLLASLVPGDRRILINPDLKELSSALRSLQKGCRKHIITPGMLAGLYNKALEPGFFSACMITANSAPMRYGYDFKSSQAAAVNLGPGLTGFLLIRVTTPSGDDIPKPIYSLTLYDEDYDPREWLKNVLSHFWTQLTDEEIRYIENQSMLHMMLIQGRKRWVEDAKWRERQLRRLTRRPMSKAQYDKWIESRYAKACAIQEQEYEISERIRKGIEKQRLDWEAFLIEWMEDMFALGRPQPVSELYVACSELAAELEEEGIHKISWTAFKRRKPGIAEGYKSILTAQLRNGGLTCAMLRNIKYSANYSLSFSMWHGLQMTFDDPQVVFRVNAENTFRTLAFTDTESMKAVNEALAGNCYGSHPADEWSVGWLRVHKDDENKILFVDEIQSDALEELRRFGKDIDSKAVSRVLKSLRRWHLFGFASIIEWGRQLGYRTAVHSRVSASGKDGMTPSKRKWNTYYAPVIKHFRLQEETVPGYPSAIMVGT